ncbi:hypothetical protein F441_04219 [Phytophthora nicotianae CJ01A1]|uniref:TAZ-type domain-containing protein n=4 Tax=Phytophthora nicotianae TaxID=4792 RepID=V9FQG5_PHYNI|nr:hypothetical protein F443_04272 [Phytophthora nicotianae P1569]ETK92545.1 hypothetical protein L915_04128 [Phytophthora nicotianae]ETO81299.1 hypothetical protein F444_04328 [Phytophthora nicotianae P1976]ETP22363.1 hypothetical protein F441_04219 [Phytophthora nicotianae CJ01A1]ETL45953.1 hypothetical protein L916_04083 [Phytophthora nicotianae]
MVDLLCSWCRAERWLYKCSTCDPRKEKTLCSKCSMLWHSRGFGRSHQLTSSYGETRSFLAWGSPRPNGVANNISSASAETKLDENRDGVIANGDRAQEVIANGVEDTKPAATKPEETRPEGAATTTEKEESRQDREEKGNTSVEENYEFEVMGESVSSGEDTDMTSVEQDGKLEETKDSSAEETPVTTANSASALVPTTENAAPRVDNQSILSVDEEKKKSLSSSQASTPPASTSTSNTSNPAAEASSVSSTAPPASAHAPSSARAAPSTAVSSVSGSALTPAPPSSASAINQPTTAAATQSRTWPTPQSKRVDLEKLLRWFPTTDHVLVEMLATRIEATLAIEDALICARIGKCEEQTCRSILLHYEHCKRDEICSDPKCTEISIIYRHRRACSAKDTAPTSDGKKSVCPFCIRIRQRRTLGVCAAFDHLINDQRRAMQGAHSEAARNFCLQSINRWTERKQPLRAESDRLNQLARESSAPIFNFPRYKWHFSDNVFIKREPTPLEENEGATSEQSAAVPSANGSNVTRVAEQFSETHTNSDNSHTPDERNTQKSQDRLEDSIPGTANFNADFINQLLRAKLEREKTEMAQREFDGVMQLGYAIVDASFCAPSKAQRCLLNCKSILDHLQHHLDLQVCNKPMCGAVEHHFAHLSECKARDESESCEYCLRMEERRLIRAVDFMEVEQPEAEAKVQKIINEITASFTNHRPDEREQEMIQLEDELDQAESNKQELLEKLGARRNELRQVRRSMESRGISASNSRQLPVHFTKTRRSEGSGGNKKRRLADAGSSS